MHTYSFRTRDGYKNVIRHVNSTLKCYYAISKGKYESEWIQKHSVFLLYAYDKLLDLQLSTNSFIAGTRDLSSIYFLAGTHAGTRLVNTYDWNVYIMSFRWQGKVIKGFKVIMLRSFIRVYGKANENLYKVTLFSKKKQFFFFVLKS